MPRKVAGDTFYSILRGATDDIGVYTFELFNIDDETVAIAETAVGIEDIGGNALRYKGTAPDNLGTYQPRWHSTSSDDPFDDDDLLEVVAAGQADAPLGPWFASADDVAARLGRELTDAETDQVEGVLATLDGLIRDEVDRDADWAPSPVPPALKELSIQKAIAAVANPLALAGYSEGLGAHSYSANFRRDQPAGIFISDAEGRALRLAVYGTNAGSGSARSMIDRSIDLLENRDVDEPET